MPKPTDHNVVLTSYSIPQLFDQSQSGVSASLRVAAKLPPPPLHTGYTDPTPSDDEERPSNALAAAISLLTRSSLSALVVSTPMVSTRLLASPRVVKDGAPVVPPQTLPPPLKYATSDPPFPRACDLGQFDSRDEMLFAEEEKKLQVGTMLLLLVLPNRLFNPVGLFCKVGPIQYVNNLTPSPSTLYPPETGGLLVT